MDLATVYKHGVVRRSSLRAAGITRYRLRQLFASGALVPIGRSYVAAPNCDPRLLRAIRIGGRIGCLSAASYRGLWVLDDGRFHVVVPTNHPRAKPDSARPRAQLHWVTRELRPSTHAGMESVHDMLAHVARCQPLPRAVAVFDSAVRKGLVDLAELQQLARSIGGAFASVVALTVDDSDSGLESLARVGLALVGVECRRQVWLDGHPVDLLIGDRLVIQLDGAHHEDRLQLQRDRAQDRRLRLMGYTVLRFGYDDIVRSWDATLEQILGFIAQGVHLR